LAAGAAGPLVVVVVDATLGAVVEEVEPPPLPQARRPAAGRTAVSTSKQPRKARLMCWANRPRLTATIL
jgi:hypothetical protein